MQKPFPTRDSGVDLARTLAIFGVVLVHSTGIGFGRWGVQLFFLISGYLLADFRKYESSLSFLIRRALRLFPLYFLFLSYFYINEVISVDIYNIFLLSNLYWTNPQVPGGWSISSEWLFSLLIVVIGLQTRLKISFWIGLSIILQVVAGLYVYMLGGADSVQNSDSYQFLTWLNTTNPLINVSFFMIGIAIKRGLVPRLTSRKQLFALFAFCVWIDLMVGHAMVVWNLGIYSIFLWCLCAKIGSGLERLVSFIGKRTYGIFFSHYILLGPVSSLIPNRLDSIPYVGTLSYFILVLLSSILCGWITWVLIESPCLKISKRIIHHIKN
jgi:peptidoglycan/LPS O-acetylase OafA/YrhL